MTTKEKVFIIITPGFAKDEADQNCIPTQQHFIRCLNKLLPDVKLLILALNYPYKKGKYQWYGNTVFSFNGKNRGGVIKLLVRRQAYSILEEINVEHEITGILSFWYNESALIGKRFANKYGLIHKCWMWGQDARPGNKYINRVRLLPEDIVVLSDFLQDEFERNYHISPHHIIPPGIEEELYGSTNDQRDIDLIAAGSLIELKRYDIFISVVEKLNFQKRDIKAVLFGDGPEKQKLQDLISSKNLEDTIKLVGELPHQELLKYMQRAKVFLHPSAYEGFGIVCIEALFAGCNVVSFCKPMDQTISRWYIVDNEGDMIREALELLGRSEHKSDQPFQFMIEDTIKKFIELFHLK